PITKTSIQHKEQRLETPPARDLSLEHVIQFLQSVNEDYNESTYSMQKAKMLETENGLLQKQIETLESELTKTNKKLKVMEEDYGTFLQIMDRARKMTVFDEYNTNQSPVFKMDKNGNLEQYIQDATK